MKKILLIILAIMPVLTFAQQPGNFSNISLTGPAPSVKTNKLYAVGSHLWWNTWRIDTAYGSSLDTSKVATRWWAGRAFAPISTVSFPGLGTDHSHAAYGDHSHSGVYEPVISAGISAQYWRGDKTWQSFPAIPDLTSYYTRPENHTVSQYYRDQVITQGTNLFDKTKATAGYWMYEGSPSALGSLSYSDYIFCTPGQQLTISDGGHSFCFFDINKNYVSMYFPGSTTATTPANCYYVVINYFTAYKDSFHVSSGGTLLAYDVFKYTINSNVETAEKLPLKTTQADVSVFQSTLTIHSNLFNRFNVTPGYYISSTGGLSAASTYCASEYIKISPSTVYTISEAQPMSFYDINKTFVSTISVYTGAPYAFTSPAAAQYIRISVAYSTASENAGDPVSHCVLMAGSSAPDETLYGYTLSEKKIDHNLKLKLSDAWTAWLHGDKFPVGLFGNSTYDGALTTGWDMATNSHYSADVAAGGVGLADWRHPYAFPYVLEQYIQAETGNSNARIYNIGYSGASFPNTKWNLPLYFSGAYSDMKMCGIGMGINDRWNYTNEYDFAVGFRAGLIYAINYLQQIGVQPFLLTTIAVGQAGTSDYDGSSHPLVNTEAINAVSNRIKRDVAKEYGLELIDITEFTEKVLTHSQHSLANLMTLDYLHGKDTTYRILGGYIFSKICPRVVNTGNENTLLLGLTCQNAKSDFPWGNSTLTTNYTNYSGLFKVKLNTTKSGTTNIKTYDVVVMNNSDTAYNATFYSDYVAGDATYVVVDGVTTPITSAAQSLGSLDIGLHTLKAYTGASTIVKFQGFRLSKQTKFVATSDSRLSDSRPASDVYAWAKAATPPVPSSLSAGTYTITATYANTAGTANGLASGSYTVTVSNANSAGTCTGNAATVSNGVYTSDTASLLLSRLRAGHDYQPKGSYVTGTPWTGMGYLTTTGLGNVVNYLQVKAADSNSTATGGYVSPKGLAAKGYLSKSDIDIIAWIGIDTTNISTTPTYFIKYSQGYIIDSIIYSVVRNAGSPDVTVKLWYGSNINSAGTALVTAGNQVTSYAGQTKTGTINNATIAAGNVIWATFSAVAVKPKSIFITLKGHKI